MYVYLTYIVTYNTVLVYGIIIMHTYMFSSATNLNLVPLPFCVHKNKSNSIHVELASRNALIHCTISIRGYTLCAIDFSRGFWYGTLLFLLMFEGAKLLAVSMIERSLRLLVSGVVLFANFKIMTISFFSFFFFSLLLTLSGAYPA